MRSSASTIGEYLDALPEDRREAVSELIRVIRKQLPKGFSEVLNYNMPGFVVPHTLYPAGYHCDPKRPLPFINIASQKNFIAIYHMGLYASPDLLEWFTAEYAKHSKTKPDMGKSCIRFKKPEQIPYKLLGELAAKMSPAEWIALYEKGLKR